MSRAINLIESAAVVHLNQALVYLVEAEGGTPNQRINFVRMAQDELKELQKAAERAFQEIERELQGESLPSERWREFAARAAERI